MSSASAGDRLAEAVEDVAAAWPDLEEVVRTDVDGAGGLVLTAAGKGRMRWFTHDDRGLIEHDPARDPGLPLSAYLGSAHDWRILSYRPGRRMVLLVCRGDAVNVFKGYKQARSARAAVNVGVAEAAMRRGCFRVPHLVRRDGGHEALVLEYVASGEVDLHASSARLYARLGERLAAFQRDEAMRDVAVFTLAEELAVLERWSDKVLTALGGLPEGWTETHARLGQAARRLPQPVMGLTHRDLHDRQVHVAGEDVALFDFDLLCSADVALDPANLVAHLRWRALQGLHGADGESVGALSREFLGALGRSSEPGFAVRLAFYEASALLRLALVYRLRPRWHGRVTQLVAMAGALLDELAQVPMNRRSPR
jgi:hypothetical protein